jgi:choline dehydrogenase-like flavoprotein
MTLAKGSYEAIVLGSGFGGAVATCRLAQAGVDVAVIERGRRFPLGSFPRHRLRPDLQDRRRGGTYVFTHARGHRRAEGIEAELWEHPRPCRRQLLVVERLAAAGRLPAEPGDDTPPRIRARATVGRVSEPRSAERARA